MVGQLTSWVLEVVAGREVHFVQAVLGLNDQVEEVGLLKVVRWMAGVVVAELAGRAHD
jgi:hypothetical protein